MTHTSLTKLAENEAVFRKRNEAAVANVKQIQNVAHRVGDASLAIKDTQKLQYCCECADEDCTERVSISTKAYEKIHTKRDQFIVVPHHDVGKIEDIIERRSGYHVVKKVVTPPENPLRLHETDIDNA